MNDALFDRQSDPRFVLGDLFALRIDRLQVPAANSSERRELEKVLRDHDLIEKASALFIPRLEKLMDSSAIPNEVTSEILRVCNLIDTFRFSVKNAAKSDHARSFRDVCDWGPEVLTPGEAAEAVRASRAPLETALDDRDEVIRALVDDLDDALGRSLHFGEPDDGLQEDE